MFKRKIEKYLEDWKRNKDKMPFTQKTKCGAVQIFGVCMRQG